MNLAEYNQCVKITADGLYRFALKTLQDDDDAQDVVQQSFLTLWENRKKVLAEKAKSYLFTVAYRRCMDEFRHRRHVTAPEMIANNLVTDNHAPPDLKAQLQKALSRLTAQHRMLVLLKDYEGYKYEEIATLTELTTDQVKVYLHRARKLLKDYLVSTRHLI